MGKYNGLIITVLLFFVNVHAYASGDSYISGYNPMLFPAYSEKHTVLNLEHYKHTVDSARSKVKTLLANLEPHRNKSLNEQIIFLVQAFADLPYIYLGATGEGDWQPTSAVYKPGAIHLKQDPVYRLDGFDCQTLVQVVLAFLHARNLTEFDETILKIAYGAAGNPHGEIVRFYNRNHFIDGDWNPINQKNGFINDVTTDGHLSSYAAHANAHLTRQHWFLQQQKNLANVRVLDDAHGFAMIDRLKTIYAKLNFPNFNSQKISLSYLPKESLVLRQKDGTFAPNSALLDKIPTPAIAEIVRDVKKWEVNGRNIKEIIGSELTISHLGLLYRQTFKKGDLIYKKITCHMNACNETVCNIKPVFCEQTECTKLMFAHATTAYPNDYYFYQRSDNFYVCSPHPPQKGVYTRCNRVEQVPFFNYLADLRFYSYMDNPSILGVHIEKILG